MSTLAGARYLTNEKRLLIALRSVVTLVLVAFFVSRPAHFETPWQFWFTLALFGLSNVVLLFEELKVFRMPRAHLLIFAFDVAMISVLMIFLGERSSEFYVVFFMTIFVAAASKSVRYAFAVCVMMSALYWLLASRGVADVGVFSGSFLTRVVFFFVVSMFVGYLSEEAETRRKRVEQLAEKARKAEDVSVGTEERLRILFERAPDAYYLNDLKGMFVDGNRAAEELTGHKRDELIGKSFLELKLLPARQIPKAAALLAKNALGKPTGPDEFVLNRKDGTQVSVEIRTFPVKIGEQSLVLGIARDTTERRRMEDALRESEEKYRGLIENMNDLVFSVDTQGRIRYVGPQAERFGADPDEAVSRNIMEFVLPEDRERVGAAFGRMLATGEETPTEFRMRDKDGRIRWMEDLGKLQRDGQGRVTEFTGVLRDITERKEVEEAERRKTQDIEHLSRAALEFAALPPEGDIYEHIASRLKDLVGNSIVLVSSFDEKSETVEIRSVVGLGKLTGTVLKLLGTDLVGMRFALLPDLGPLLRKGELVKLSKQMHELAQGKLSVKALKACAKLLGIGDVYSLGMVREGQLFASATILAPPGAEFKNTATFAAFANQASVALQRKLAEEREKRHVRGLEHLSRTALEFAGYPPDEDIYEHIAKRLKELTGDSVVLVDSFDESSGMVEIRAIVGLGKLSRRALELLGRSPVGMRFQLLEEHGRLFTKGGLVDLQEGIYELAQGQVPKPVCDALDKLVGIEHIYSLGFARGGRLFAHASIIVRKGAELENRTVIEAFANQASVALHRRLAEEALRESEKRYRDLVENIADLVQSVAPDGTLIYANRAWRETLGYEEKEVQGLPLFGIIHPDSLEHCQELFQRVMAGEEVKGIETKFVTKDGRTLLVEGSAGCRFADGKPVATHGIFRDVTERKRAEEALRLSAVQWQSTFDAMADGVFLLDSKQRIEKCNESICKLLRKTSEELLGHHCWEVVHRTSAPIEGCPHVCMLETHERESMGLALGDRAYDVTADPVLDQNGRVMGSVHILKDVTERKRAEEAVRESEEKWRSLVENAPDIVMTVARDGTIQFINRTVPGLTVEEVIGKRIYEFVPSEYHDTLRECVEGVFETGEAGSYETAGAGPDGSTSWYSTRVAPVRREGRVVATTHLCRDVTNQKRAEEALRQRTRDLGERVKEQQCLYAASRLMAEPGKPLDAVFEAVVDVIRAGWQYPEITCARISFGDQRFTTRNFRACSWKQVANILVSGEMAGTVEVCYLEEKPVMFEGPFVAEERSLIDALATEIGRFIERRRAEERLRASEQKYRAVVENTADVAYSADAEGMLTFLGPQAVRYGVAPEEAVSRNLLEFVVPEDRERVARDTARSMATGEGCPTEFRVHGPDGRTHWFEDQGVILRNASGEVTGVSGALRDITERKEAEKILRETEEQLRQSQKLEAIGRLAGGVAHDFNNMLGAIIGYGDVILTGLAKGDPLRKDIEHIKSAADRAAALTRQLLAFSRKQALQPKVMDLNAHITGLEKMLRRLIGEDVELAATLADDLGPVRADPGQIDQIVMNLAVNARDAMPEGGKLTIETANVELDEDYAKGHVGVAPGPHVMLAVSDTGCGMDAETRSQIFEPFFTTKETGKGTGLGLSTVYGIVKQSGGSIWVYSEPGEGTTFKIYVPRVEEAVEAVGRQEPTEAQVGGSETILVVEDEEVLRRLVCRILRLAGYTVLEAANGGEALMLCEQHDGAIHLLVTDVVMPKIGGRKLAERVAPLRPKMKLAYMSGYTDDAVVRNGQLPPGVPFIQKPFTASNLTRTVREVLDSPATVAS